MFEPTEFEIQMNYYDFVFFENMEAEYMAWLIEQEEEEGEY